MVLSTVQVRKFRRTILGYYQENGRDFDWRATSDPYHILVSEFMLQQTQTGRVTLKYPEFIKKFPCVESLAKASVQEVLSEWQGLGYNRRALALHKTAGIIVSEYEGKIPGDHNILMGFPGIGKATASAILAFAFNIPVVFIETNIRHVYLHFFFADSDKVHDTELYPLVKQTLDTTKPREWYYALMDYGVMLKKKYPSLNKKSTHYHKQSRFEDSDRQLRGRILRYLLQTNSSTGSDLLKHLKINPERLKIILTKMKKEGFLTKIKTNWLIKT